MIAKKIHYCWFGGGEKPEIVLKCIASWKKFCPDWDIVEWNETNFDIECHPFMTAAYEAKKWAFVVDVARVLIIQEHGGIYLDTDVELIAPIDDWLLGESVFFFESIVYINGGMGFGAVANHSSMKELLKYYTDVSGDRIEKIDFTKHVSPRITTNAITKAIPKMVIDGTITQNIDGNYILSMDDYGKYAKHHGTSTWVDGPRKRYNSKRTKVGIWIQKKLKNPKYFQFVLKYFGGRCYKIYIFFAYDFFDCGIGYFIRRKIYKFINKHK